MYKGHQLEVNQILANLLWDELSTELQFYFELDLNNLYSAHTMLVALSGGRGKWWPG